MPLLLKVMLFAVPVVILPLNTLFPVPEKVAVTLLPSVRLPPKVLLTLTSAVEPLLKTKALSNVCEPEVTDKVPFTVNTDPVLNVQLLPATSKALLAATVIVAVFPIVTLRIPVCPLRKAFPLMDEELKLALKAPPNVREPLKVAFSML